MRRQTGGPQQVGLLAAAIGVLLLVCGLRPAAAGTEAIYARYKDAVLQVRIVDRASGEKSSIGSGFLVGDGMVVTNYHVVADLISKPERYRIDYLHADGHRGDLTLYDIDVVHDLALLRGAPSTARPLQLAATLPIQGERLFSFGNPHDLGLTIVEGTFNGLRENSLYEKIHFTGSINPGMSGGPALNRQGEVVGVNVSTAGNQISFLVPVRYVSALLRRQNSGVAQTGASGPFHERMRTDLLANQARYLAPLLAAPFAQEEIAGFSLPVKLGPFFKCWGDSRHEEDEFYEQVTQSCSTSDDIYLADDQFTGTIRFRHDVYSDLRLGSLRFYGLLEREFNASGLDPGGEEESVGTFACSTDFVTQHDDLYKVVYCLRGYKKMAGLYDVFLTVASLRQDQRGLQSSLILSGVSADNARQFSQHFLEAIRWNPKP